MSQQPPHPPTQPGGSASQPPQQQYPHQQQYPPANAPPQSGGYPPTQPTGYPPPNPQAYPPQGAPGYPPGPQGYPPQPGYPHPGPMQQPYGVGAPVGLWRQGNILVMHKYAQLPEICVKSNRPTTQKLRRNLQWHHPAIALSILIGLIVYVVLALVLTKRATIFIGLSEEWFAKRRLAIAVGWAIALLSVALVPLGMFLMMMEFEWAPLLFLAAVVLFLAAIIYGQYASRMVAPKRMTDDYIWLKGVNPQFLEPLPQWTYNI